MAYPLSVEHTLYRQDERERVRASGGLVLPASVASGAVKLPDDWDGALAANIDSPGDPPRVYAPGVLAPGQPPFPGCVFTRSLGDSLAAEYGVIAEPDVARKVASTSAALARARTMQRACPRTRARASS